MRKIVTLVLLIVFLILSVCTFASCEDSEFGIRDKNDPFVELTISNGDKIRLELYPDVAPISVANFLKYVEDGFYDGVIFHRIIRGFMIQAGGFEEKDGMFSQKEATYGTIKGEFALNNVSNNLSHTRGVISMARATAYDSASSQFFICSDITSDNTRSLNGKYAAFGRVIDRESMDVVSRLEKVLTTSAYLYYGETPNLSDDVPVEPIYIQTARIIKID